MTPRETALLLRLAAAETTREQRSIIVLRRILRDMGWDDAELDAACLRLRAACGAFVQASFERAA
jgi:hypothetical protein